MSDKKLLTNGQKYPFKIISDESNNKFKFEIDQDNIFYPEEITAIVLNNIKECAEKQIGNNVENAVISVPASFNDSQRQSTIDAAKIAGFKTIRLLNDTTAAAIAYVYDKNLESKKKIMVFDLGGHYLNLSIVNIENGVVEVQSAFSVPELGGQTFDFRMAQYLEKIIKEDSNKDISQNMKVYQSLLAECEIAKKNLSNGLESFHKISLDYEDVKFKFTRDLFEILNQDLFDKIIGHVDDFIGDLKLKLSDIDDVLIIGGSSRIPKLQSLLSLYFDGKKLNYTMNASETVAYGTSIQAAFLSGNKLKHNNGYKYVDLINRNYVLKILHNRNEELFNIFMPAKTQLSVSQFASIKKALLKRTLTLEMKENNNTINTLDIDYGHLNQVDINFNIDLNGIFSIILANFDQNDIQKKKLVVYQMIKLKN
jgi:molecular chaperone DnaK (HSP70)